MVIISKLTELRIKMNISQRQMAKALKCTPTTLNRYEKGKRRMYLDMVIDYANELGVEFKIQVK
jgi:transcriptional regulator with XRE-family HTH domain